MSIHLSSYFTIPERYSYHDKIFLSFKRRYFFCNKSIRLLPQSAATDIGQKHRQGTNLHLGGLKQQNMSHAIGGRIHGTVVTKIADILVKIEPKHNIKKSFSICLFVFNC